ncbi:MAG: hypothetical protein E7214_16940 [Clostridium sp.]|nr:hypothetical protein [Clostridium sp.]
METFIIVKANNDEEFIENLDIEIYGNGVAFRGCYVTKSDIDKINKDIFKFTNSNKSNCYIVLGEDTGDYSAFFSMKISKNTTKTDNDTEIDIEFNNLGSLECNDYHFYVKTKLEMLQQFFKKIKEIIYEEGTSEEEAVLKAFSIIPDKQEEEYTYEEFDYDVTLGREVEIQYKSDEINYFISIDNKTNCPSLYNCD